MIKEILNEITEYIEHNVKIARDETVFTSEDWKTNQEILLHTVNRINTYISNFICPVCNGTGKSQIESLKSKLCRFIGSPIYCNHCKGKGYILPKYIRSKEENDSART